MNARRAATLIALTLIVAQPALCQAQVYSWKDANGKVHYGSQPPAGQSVETRKLAPAPAATADEEAARKANAEKQMAEREKQQKAQEGAKKTQEDQANAKVREENCRQAKANLASIDSGQTRFIMDAKGERMALDGTVRDAELRRARQNVDTWCKPAK